MSLREALKKELNVFIIETISKEGQAVLPEEAHDDWRDRIADYHIQGINHSATEGRMVAGEKCQWAPSDNTTVAEHEVQVWKNNPVDNNPVGVEFRSVVEISNMNCGCGKYEEYTIRYQGTFSEFIQKFLTE